MALMSRLAAGFLKSTAGPLSPPSRMPCRVPRLSPPLMDLVGSRASWQLKQRFCSTGSTSFSKKATCCGVNFGVSALSSAFLSSACDWRGSNPPTHTTSAMTRTASAKEREKREVMAWVRRVGLSGTPPRRRGIIQRRQLHSTAHSAHKGGVRESRRLHGHSHYNGRGAVWALHELDGLHGGVGAFGRNREVTQLLSPQ